MGLSLHCDAVIFAFNDGLEGVNGGESLNGELLI